MYFSQTGVALRGAPIHNVLAEPCGLSHMRLTCSRRDVKVWASGAPRSESHPLVLSKHLMDYTRYLFACPVTPGRKKG